MRPLNKTPNPQLLPGHRSNMAAHCSGCVFTVCVCVCVCVCACVCSLLCVCTWMGQMQSTNSEYGSPYLATRHFTSLSLNSFMPGCANHFTKDCFLYEGQFKACFVKKFHRREGRGEQCSLAWKEICTETSHCEQSCFWQGKKGVVLHDHWDHFKKTLMNHTTLWKMGIRCPLWSTATTKSD